jgi:YfiR/HmsC-like
MFLSATKYRRLKILFVAIVLCGFSFNAQAMEDSEVQAYVSFIRDLINTTTTTRPNGITCTFGSDEIASALLLQDPKSINLDKSPEKFAQCKAIYIAKGSEKNLKPEIVKFTKNKIMTVAIFDGFVETGGMAQVQMGRRNFEITLNSRESKTASVRLNALLLSLVIN